MFRRKRRGEAFTARTRTVDGPSPVQSEFPDVQVRAHSLFGFVRWWPVIVVALLVPFRLAYFNVTQDQIDTITESRLQLSLLDQNARRILEIDLEALEDQRFDEDDARSIAALLGAQRAILSGLDRDGVLAERIGLLEDQIDQFQRDASAQVSFLRAGSFQEARAHPHVLSGRVSTLAGTIGDLDRAYQARVAGLRATVNSVGLGLGIVTTIAVGVVFFMSIRRSRRLDLREGVELAEIQNERWFRALVEKGSDMIVVLGGNGEILYRSPATAWALGDSSIEVPPEGFPEVLHPDDLPAVGSILADALQGSRGSGEFVCRILHRDGGWRWCEITMTNLLQEPSVRGVVLNGRDITDERSLQEQLAHLALHDPLTGLPNRALLADRLERAGRSAGSGAVLLLDLDDFQTVNDSLGHSVGDEILREVASRLTKVVRAEDTVGRLGGDEFVLLLTDSSEEAARETAGRILDAVRRPFDVAGPDLRINGSIGVTLIGPAESALEDVIRDAELAMYSAKADGKDSFRLFDAGMREVVVARLQLKTDLQHALDRGELFVAYQPIFELQTGRLAGAEALIRWKHPTQGIMPPSEFIPQAEESGSILPIGSWVLHEACAQLEAWQRAVPVDQPLRMGINVSIKQLEEHSFLAEVDSILRRLSIPPDTLVLEITESIAADRSAIRHLERLRELGVSIAIDDFGTGYSSLSALRDYPADVVKIDRSFVSGLRTSSLSASMIRGIVTLADALGMRTLAEGIETVEQLVSLRELGCLFGQGYHLGKPGPPVAIEEIIHGHQDAARSTVETG